MQDGEYVVTWMQVKAASINVFKKVHDGRK